MISVWKPFAGVTVRTTVTPMGEWHIREHEIVTDRAIHAAEGGFAIARGGNGEVETMETADCTAVIAPWGVSGVRNLLGYTGGTVVMPEPNTNLMVPRTLLPTLTVKLEPGRHVLRSAVLGSANQGREQIENPPTEVSAYGKMD